jgi:predicted transcriptional regulator
VKSASFPPLRVEPALRRAAERVLREGESLSAFVEEAVRRGVEWRQVEDAFIARGLASEAEARESGRFVTASSVLKKLEKRLARSRRSQ